MDLEENIKIAAEVYAKEKHPPLGFNEDWKDDGFDEGYNAAAHHKVNTAFIDGAKSQAAKEYWYNEFKRERTPIKLTDQEKLDIEYGITPLGRQHRQYLKDNPDKPMSFNDWKNMIKDSSDFAMRVNGEHPYYPFGTVQSDPLYGATNKMFDNVTPGGGHPFTVTMEEDWFKPFDEETIKELLADLKPQVEKGERPIGIIGHVDHGKSIKCVIVGVGSQMLIPEERFEVMENLKPDLSAIKSIVPIADVIPEPIISKQEFLEMHDKAVERSITEETYRESRAWDIKKEKKVSHKRNNKRK